MILFFSNSSNFLFLETWVQSFWEQIQHRRMAEEDSWRQLLDILMVFLNYLRPVIYAIVFPPSVDWSLDLFPDIPYCNLHDFEQHFNIHGPFSVLSFVTDPESERVSTDFAQDTIVLDLTMQFPFCPWLCQALWRLVCTFVCFSSYILFISS